MIKLEDNALSFTFPEIARQLTALLEQHIQDVRPKLRLPEHRHRLVDTLGEKLAAGHWRFRRWSDVPPKRRAGPRPAVRRVSRIRGHEPALDTAEALTEADVDKAFRKATYAAARLPDDSLASVTISFQRTLRIPDDGKTYPLPAGLGLFPLRSVDDFSETVPASYAKRGGVLMPMYQSEALWISLSSSYPFAVKVAAGKINAVSGTPWTSGLQKEPQDYVVVPSQRWLDGFAVGEGLIQQFVAMPLGAGYSVEEQLTGQAEVGGIQLQAYPMSAESYFRKKVVPSLPFSLDDLLMRLFAAHIEENISCRFPGDPKSMGLGAGGRMRQEIYADPYDFAAWDQTQTCRCFVHLCNSLIWRQVTGTNPPHPPLTAKEYERARIPWFDYYRDDLKPLKGSKRLAGVKSVTQLGKEKNNQPLPENSSIAPKLIVQYGNTRRPGEIREFLDTP